MSLKYLCTVLQTSAIFKTSGGGFWCNYLVVIGIGADFVACQSLRKNEIAHWLVKIYLMDATSWYYC